MSLFRNAQQKIAHTSTVPSLGNKEFRNLQDVITTEKDFVKSNSKAQTDWKKNSEALKTWGESEGEDLNDVLSKLSLLFNHYETSQTRFNSHLSTIRLHFKSLRTREESLSDLKSRKRSLGSRIEAVEKKLAKMGPENKELMKTTSMLKEYRSEMEGMIIEVRNEEAALGDFKRRTTKDAMGLKCGGLLEMAEKLTIVAEIGKLMIEEIPLDVTEPGMPRRQYDGFSKTEQLLSEATRCIADVGFAPASSGQGAQTFGGHQRRDTSLNGIGEDEERGAGTENYATDPYGQGQGAFAEDQYDQATPTEGFQSTPIYANNQSTFRTGQWAESQSQGKYDSTNPNERGETGLSTDGGVQDTAADEWGRSAGAAIAGAGSLDGPDRETQAAQEAYGRRDSQQEVEDEYSSKPATYSGTEGGENINKETSTNGNGYQLEDGPSSSSYGVKPRSRDNSNEAPILPPITTSTPLPSTTGALSPSTPSAAPISPSTPGADQDDASYFASIGSTRAAQAAVSRRPNSPPSSRYSGVPTVAVAQPALSSASIQKYEPAPEGRKMTAAAFRKGFARVPSAQNVSGGASSSGNLATSSGRTGQTGEESAPGSSIGHQEDSNSSVQPLAIKKRNSYQPPSNSNSTINLQQQSLEGIENPAPAYDAGGGSNAGNENPRDSVYGGMGDDGQGSYHYQQQQPQQANQYAYNDPYSNGNGNGNPGGYPDYSRPQQPWTQQGPGSRPTSAQGQRPQSGQPAGYYPSYPTSGY